jgi:hypothetical protein
MKIKRIHAVWSSWSSPTLIVAQPVKKSRLRVYRSVPIHFNPSELNPNKTFKKQLSEINFNIILPFMVRSSKWSLIQSTNTNTERDLHTHRDTETHKGVHKHTQKDKYTARHTQTR